VRRLETASGVAPTCVARVSRKKCDYCVQVGHPYKKIYLLSAYSTPLIN
jgi:hypothetical protein